MTKRKIASYIESTEDGSYVAEVRVYRDAEWEEYVARLYVNGVLYAPADCHDDQKDSIIHTAKAMLAQAFAARFNP